MMNNESPFDPTQYDFLYIIKTYYEKLTDRHVLTILWDQMMKKEPLNSHEEELTEYRMHLPVDLYKHLEILELKFSELPKENLQFFDGSYKTYLITFLFFCTKRTGTVTDKTKLIACSLYLKLTILPEIGKFFFIKSMYMYQMLASSDIIKSCDVDSAQKETIIKLVKCHCIQKDHLDNELLAVSTNVIVTSMIIGATVQMIRRETAKGLTECCMKALHAIMLHISNSELIKFITRRLFRCITKQYLKLIPNQEIAVDVIILFLKGTLKIKGFDRKIEFILDGFKYNWLADDFNNYKGAIQIMNVFPEEHYKDMLRKLITITEPRSKTTILINVFHLIQEILIRPPSFPFDKITVLYTCIIRNVLHHILNSDDQVVTLAIDILTDINEATTNPLHQFIFTEARNNKKLVNLPIESVILGFSEAANQNWTLRNKKLFQLFARFVSVTPNLNPVVVQQALDGIVRDVSPKTFESSLQALQMSFLAASARGEVEIAEILVDIVHKFAFDTNYKLSSTMYASYIFNGLLNPSIVDEKMYSSKYFYSVYLTPSFDYQALFSKCRNFISEREIYLAIDNLDYKQPCSGKLLCNLLEYCRYTNINVLVHYIIDNFIELSGYATAGYICAAFETILKNQRPSGLYNHQLHIIQMLIMSGLFKQNFLIQSIKPAFNLYRTIHGILKLPQNTGELNKLFVHTEKRVVHKLEQGFLGNDNTVLYLNEICLILKKVPSDAFLSSLDNPIKLSDIAASMPDVFVQILTLLCTMGMMNKKKVSVPLKYLHESLNGEDRVMKVITIKLLYTLCREITHEFNFVIQFAFKEMVTGNPCLIRICASILEELIHEDYIKLTSENFFRFIYVLGCNELKDFMKEILSERFFLSNQNDITKFYLSVIVYSNMYGKFPNYPISSRFCDDLIRIKIKVDTPKETLEFLFLRLPIQRKFNIIMEISSIFEALLKGQCKVDDNFFNVLLDLIMTVKLMKTPVIEKQTVKHYHQNIIKLVEKQIIRFDSNSKIEEYYMEFENEIRKCTLVLLKLLFSENEQLASKIQIPLFDALIHWIDFVKAEIIHYIHEERGKEYDPYFAKLVQYYKKNKNQFDVMNR